MYLRGGDLCVYGDFPRDNDCVSYTKGTSSVVFV